MLKYYCDRCKREINGIGTALNKITIVKERAPMDTQYVDKMELCNECRIRLSKIVEAFWKGKEIEIKEG